VSQDESVTYDPSPSVDPTEAQLKSIGQMGIDLDAGDLASPEMTKFLLQNHRTSLLQYREAKKEVEKLREEKDDLVSLRESLNVKLARKEAYEEITWLEIPVSILSGFAINMLVTDIKDGFGWLLIVLSIVMLFLVRLRSIEGGNNVKD